MNILDIVVSDYWRNHNARHLFTRFRNGLSDSDYIQVMQHTFWHYEREIIGLSSEIKKAIVIGIIASLGASYMMIYGADMRLFNLLFSLPLVFLIVFVPLVWLAEPSKKSDEYLELTSICVLTDTHLFVMNKDNYHRSNSLVQSVIVRNKVALSDIVAVKSFPKGLNIYTDSMQPIGLYLSEAERETLKQILIQKLGTTLLDADKGV